MENIKKMIKNVILIVVVLLLFKAAISYQIAKTDYNTYDYLVVNNDTLWTIAGDICDEDQNIRNVIIDIKEINNMKDSTIYVGQTLKLPIYN